MLNKNITIRKGIRGIDPDKDIEIEEEKWLKKHSEKRKLSKEEKEELSKRMIKIRVERGL